jgi:hypothetical protein
MNNIVLKKACITLLLLVCMINVRAQGWSYVYIQGDKQTAFYVKLEGEMLPRYSKNYYIIPQLAAGPIHLQVLFQQNEYPAQNFTVLVPDNGYRGFLLTKKDNTFALYDIQQRFYLMPGDNGEDHLPEMISYAPKEEKAVVNTPEVATKNNDRPKLAPPGDDQPQFINNIVLDNDRTVQKDAPAQAAPVEETPLAEAAPPPPAEESPAEETPTVETPVQESPAEDSYNIAQEPTVEESKAIRPIADSYQDNNVTLSEDVAPIINSDCPEPLNQGDFDKLYHNTMDKKDDEKRVMYLMKKAEDNCFSTRQAYFLARQLGAESMRYSFLKKVYPRITDQQNFHLLEEPLFKTLEWQSYFRLIQQN